MESRQLLRLSEYYRVISTQKFGDEVRQHIRFDIPERRGNAARRRVIEETMERSGADALVEFFWTKGSIIHKNKFAFDAILIFDASHFPKHEEV